MATRKRTTQEESEAPELVAIMGEEDSHEPVKVEAEPAEPVTDIEDDAERLDFGKQWNMITHQGMLHYYQDGKVFARGDKKRIG